MLSNVAGISEIIQILLKPLNVRLSNKATNTIKLHLSHLKDNIETWEKSNIVYLIPCLECPLIYVG